MVLLPEDAIRNVPSGGGFAGGLAGGGPAATHAAGDAIVSGNARNIDAGSCVIYYRVTSTPPADRSGAGRRKVAPAPPPARTER